MRTPQREPQPLQYTRIEDPPARASATTVYVTIADTIIIRFKWPCLLVQRQCAGVTLCSKKSVSECSGDGHGDGNAVDNKNRKTMPPTISVAIFFV